MHCSPPTCPLLITIIIPFIIIFTDVVLQMLYRTVPIYIRMYIPATSHHCRSVHTFTIHCTCLQYVRTYRHMHCMCTVCSTSVDLINSECQWTIGEDKWQTANIHTPCLNSSQAPSSVHRNSHHSFCEQLLKSSYVSEQQKMKCKTVGNTACNYIHSRQLP